MKLSAIACTRSEVAIHIPSSVPITREMREAPENTPQCGQKIIQQTTCLEHAYKRNKDLCWARQVDRIQMRNGDDGFPQYQTKATAIHPSTRGSRLLKLNAFCGSTPLH